MIKTVNQKLKSIHYLGTRSFGCKYRVLRYYLAGKVAAPMRQDMTYMMDMTRSIEDVEDSTHWRGRLKRLMEADETGEELGVDAFIARLQGEGFSYLLEHTSEIRKINKRLRCRIVTGRIAFTKHNRSYY
jgi:hypothetical protein